MMKLALRSVVAATAAGFAVFTYVFVTLPDVRPLATTNPARTAWMDLRAREAAAAGKTLRHEHRWVPYGRISQHLKRAVLVAEDAGFWDHEGIDLEAVKEAMQEATEKGRPPRGASTITQQLAKNLYLSPSRDPLRKLREIIIARRLEAALEKARILEIYLNVIEWGDGVWGAEAAARRYFGVPASALEPSQAALLAGAIINPRVYSPAAPPRRLLNRQRIIMARMGTVTPPVPAPAPPSGKTTELPGELERPTSESSVQENASEVPVQAAGDTPEPPPTIPAEPDE